MISWWHILAHADQFRSRIKLVEMTEELGNEEQEINETELGMVESKNEMLE